MKSKKVLALLAAVTLIFVQFTILGVVYAEDNPLSGRTDPFVKGVHIHP